MDVFYENIKKQTACTLTLVEINGINNYVSALGHEKAARYLDTVWHWFAWSFQNIPVHEMFWYNVTTFAVVASTEDTAALDRLLNNAVNDFNASTDGIGLALKLNCGRTEYAPGSFLPPCPLDFTLQAKEALKEARKLRFWDRSSVCICHHENLHPKSTDELFVAYQPQKNVANNTIIGYEALLRWKQGANTVLPSGFVPQMEKTGTIVPIGLWVLETACAEVVSRHWAGDNVRLSVNVSARQLMENSFLDDVLKILRRTNFQPNLLTLELTESLLMEGNQQAEAHIKALASHGICISLDDFGTGFSSLKRLAEYPIGEIKIDKTFTRNVHKNHTARGIIKTLLAFGLIYSTKIVAEGIESPEQSKALAQLGATIQQGWLHGKPQKL
ncbi:MAG: EAL domain-containing protein [Trichlorobacter sp.]|nr:EAL domain-containing protein [Trichlorobacter sp.]